MADVLARLRREARRARRLGVEPRERVGLCCGEHCPDRGYDVLLHRVRPFVYRCARCYQLETGMRI